MFNILTMHQQYSIMRLWLAAGVMLFALMPSAGQACAT
jgi:hypothetical protein